MTAEDKLILLGIISSAHGIKGDVTIKSFTQPPENIVNLQVIDKNHKPIFLEFIYFNSKGDLICRIEGCDTRNKAEAVKRTALYCFRSSLSEINTKDEFYIEDLKGLKVLNKSGELIGKISNVSNYGAGDIIEIKFKLDGRKELFPFTKEFFPVMEKDHIVFTGI